MIAKILHPVDAWNYLVASTGIGVSLKGVMDANAIQVWAGAIIAVAAVLWGFLRDQRRHDRVEEHAEKSRRRVDEWEAWALAYRKRRMDETGTDPFTGGIPPLRPFDEPKPTTPE